MTNLDISLAMTKAAPEQVPSRPVLEAEPVTTPAIILTTTYGGDASGTGGGGGASTNAFNLIAGNLVVVVVGVTGSSSPSWHLTGVTDVAGNTYVRSLPVYAFGFSTYATIAYCINAIGHAANVVSVTGAGGSDQTRLQVFQFAGYSNFDAEFGRSDGPSTHATISGITSTNLMVGICTNFSVGGSDSTVTNGFKYITPTAPHGGYAAGYRVGLFGSYPQSFDFSGAGNTFRALMVACFS
jgi:hypothetical protein